MGFSGIFSFPVKIAYLWDDFVLIWYLVVLNTSYYKSRYKAKEEKRKGWHGLNVTKASHLNSIFSGLVMVLFYGRAKAWFAGIKKLRMIVFGFVSILLCLVKSWGNQWEWVAFTNNRTDINLKAVLTDNVRVTGNLWSIQ